MKKNFIVMLTLLILGVSIPAVAQVDNSTLTAGDFSVSPSGAMTYNVPFDVPNYVLGHFPNLGITFNSQAGDGIAGYGWSITGLSSISRVAPTQFHDGFVDGINFNLNDRFSLDGQRLMLKEGAYGRSGSTYQTEQYSNLKIEAHGTSLYGKEYGPEYFIVYHPNGLRYWYGAYKNDKSSHSKLEWSVQRIEDTQGNYVQFVYAKVNKTLRLDRVEDPKVNVSVNFGYGTKTNVNPIAIAGEFFLNDRLLTDVNVRTGGDTYYHYSIRHKTTSDFTKIVDTVKKTNALGEETPPITFNYPAAVERSVTQRSLGNILSNPGSGSLGESSKSSVLSGDLNGDEKIDFLVYATDPTDRAKDDVLSGVGAYIYDKYLDKYSFREFFGDKAFERVFMGRIPNKLGALKTTNALIVSRKVPHRNTLRFTGYSFEDKTVYDNPSVLQEVDFKPPSQYDSWWDAVKNVSHTISDNSSGKVIEGKRINANNRVYGPKTQKRYLAEQEINLNDGFTVDYNTDFAAFVDKGFSIGEVPDLTYLSGDFNGDGITDIVALTPHYYDGEEHHWDSEVYLIDFNKEHTRDNSVAVGKLDKTLHEEKRKVYVLDHDGDGKQEIVHFTGNKFRVYGLDHNGVLKIEAIHTMAGDALGIFPGDYNGDGKTDVMVTHENNVDRWHIYLSKGGKPDADGNFFAQHIRNFGFHYVKSHAEGSANFKGAHSEVNTFDYRYIPVDFDKDGKTDLIHHRIVASLVKGKSHLNRETLWYCKNHSRSDNLLRFDRSKLKDDWNKHKPRGGHSAFASIENRNLMGQYVFAQENGNIFFYDYQSNSRAQKCVSSIGHHGLVTAFTYHGLTPSQDIPWNIPFMSTYENHVFNLKNATLRAPYYSLRNLNDFKVVEKVSQRFNGLERHKEFRYSGLVGSTNGLGVIGFSGLAQTNWYGADIATIWNMSIFDHNKRGALTRTFSRSDEGGILNEVDYTYQSYMSGNGVYGYFPTASVTKDHLTGINTSDTIVYDEYFSVLESTMNHNDGAKTTRNTYYNNPSGKGTSYYIGRPKTKTETAVLGSESFTTAEEYIYEDNFIKQLKTKGNNTSWLTETYTHDTFGNITSKTISGAGIEDRTEYSTYDVASGRFMTTTTDIDGLVTSYGYDTKLGHLITETDPFGKKQSFVYDGWNRLEKQTDYLGNTFTTTYAGLHGGGIKVANTSSLGGASETYTNRMGWKVQTQERNALDQWVKVQVEFDATGKKRRESQPYFWEHPSQWTSIDYDQYNRPLTQTLYTGQVITTFYGYQNNTVTVDDGKKTVTSKRDAVGNVVQMTDPGGTINYAYYANNTPKTTNYEGHIITTKIDGWGRKIELYDPAAGKYTYKYNILGELLEENTPKGKTTYELDRATGRPKRKLINGDQTDMVLTYLYDTPDKQISSIVGEDRLHLKNYAYQYTYDGYQRPKSVKEITPHGVTFITENKYDTTLGRLQQQTVTTQANGIDHKVITESEYHATSGQLIRIADQDTNNTLWQLNGLNERGQVTNASTSAFGVLAKNQYDKYGFLERQYTTKDSKNITDVEYSFDIKRGNLLNRHNHSFSLGQEVFTYDELGLDRLTEISGAYTQTMQYETDGRIKENSLVGTYSYQANTRYRVAGIDLNAAGKNYFETRTPQQITYNAYKKPVSIHQQGHGRVDFEYGPLMNRSIAYFGGESEDIADREYKKVYAAIAPVEVVINQNTNDAKIITYVDGDPYSASVAHIKETKTDGLDEYIYIFRDHLGSILNIINRTGDVVESTHYGAWGTIKEYTDTAGNETLGYESILGRGYTGHEHFTSVGLIHMNGRMYDAKLGRFLSPDNFIQDPYNTQNFNRFGYVLNNPLKYTDPSGEAIWVAVLIGAVVGGYLGGAHANGNFNPFEWSWDATTWVGIGVGAIIGAVAGYSIAAKTGTLIITGGANTAKGFVPLAKIGLTNKGAALSLAIVGDVVRIAFNPKTKRDQSHEGENIKMSGGGSASSTNTAGTLKEDPPGKDKTEEVVVDSDDVIVGLTGEHYATAAILSQLDGPEPFIMDVVAAGYFTYQWWTHGGQEMIDKMGREMGRILDSATGPPGFQYSLRANSSGTYPCYNCPSGEIFLNYGDVWKYGKTTIDNRYTEDFLSSTGQGLSIVPEFFGNNMQIRLAEKYKIYSYKFRYGRRPPGNRIDR